MAPRKRFPHKIFRASGEAILGTQRYSHESILNVKNFRASGEAILGTQRYFSKHFLIIFRTSGEAIVGTQRYFSKHSLMDPGLQDEDWSLLPWQAPLALAGLRAPPPTNAH